MGRPWRLENYDTRPKEDPIGAVPSPAIGEEQLEEARLEAFDRGYKAGWDDASTAHQDDQTRISAEFGHHLQALAFTYQEARAAIRKDTEALFRGLLDTVLPRAFQDTLAPTILERLGAGLDAATQPPVEITVAPENMERLERLLEGQVTPPLKITPEASLGAGQAFLKFETTEERIDLDAMIQELAALVDDFFADEPAESQQESRHAG